MRKGRLIKEFIKRGEILVSLGAFNAISARIIDQAGIPSVYVTGYGAAANILGKPDIGLLTMTEMVNHIKGIVDVVQGAVIADADTGYGNPLNVQRTVKEYERAGVAAIQLEDQIWPKRCGHMTGKQIIPAEEMVQKIRAAVDARESEDTLIIARTDAIAVEGFEEAARRIKMYHHAGADILFVEAPENLEQLKEIPKLVQGGAFLANMIEGGATPLLTAQELQDMGYAIVIYPISTLYAMTKAVMELVEEVKRSGTTAGMLSRMVSFADFNEIVGLKDFQTLEKQYGLIKE
ncbi:isocitrate lyase/PEP mutase family protein [Calderihabitans maritimus]|uniref:2-methylisocitrate lyase n=1 Tax=Calderihabitans maritimus TaxID=1246530 RepID=A0A1Z5HSS2_9FIRM|nr:isocitrate lyase/phosphoenolpyruvate mutase family protein [Calderihabitans maritimus]GAW92330.1 2,3-dimethylmalate lyase [Calderihabitans maritimus]